MIHYNGKEQWPTYLIWGLLLTDNGYKHNDMKWNIINKHLQIYVDDNDEDDDKILMVIVLMMLMMINLKHPLHEMNF